MGDQSYNWERVLNAQAHLPQVLCALESYLSAFMDPDRGLVYNSPMAYQPAFPTEEEVRAEMPNSQGWFTAIEDCSYLTPALLSGLAQGLTGGVAQDPAAAVRGAELGHRVFAGLRRSSWRSS
jgi:hypothetical protein